MVLQQGRRPHQQQRLKTPTTHQHTLYIQHRALGIITANQILRGLNFLPLLGREPFGKIVQVFTGQIPLLSPNKQCLPFSVGKLKR